MSDQTDRIKKALSNPKPRHAMINPENYLSTGLTVLNLALSGRANGGIPKGSYVFYVGDSESGKSFAAMQLMAEAARSKHFSNYRLIYDDVEGGVLMDVGKFFGKTTLARLGKNKGHSRTVDEFYDRLYGQDGPFVYVLDSMDALDTAADREKYEKSRDARAKGKDVAGSFGMSKAKANSDNIKRALAGVRDTMSILLVVSQTRDKINSPFPDKTYGGGHALKFYANVQVWTSVKGPIKRVVKNRERVVGSWIQFAVKKNRLTGWHGKVVVPFYRSVGFDEVGANVEFLTQEGHWAEARGAVTAPEFNFKGHKEKLIQVVQDNGLDGELRKIVQRVWDEVEEAARVVRKPRYT